MVRTPTKISTLTLHDALPIWRRPVRRDVLRDHLGEREARPPIDQPRRLGPPAEPDPGGQRHEQPDRKSTRLNSSHVEISYAVFCLKKKKNQAEILSKPAQEEF